MKCIFLFRAILIAYFNCGNFHKNCSHFENIILDLDLLKCKIYARLVKQCKEYEFKRREKDRYPDVQKRRGIQNVINMAEFLKRNGSILYVDLYFEFLCFDV